MSKTANFCEILLENSVSTDIDKARKEWKIDHIYYERECYERWYAGAKHYSDDVFIEDRNFERVKGAIEMEYLIRCTNVSLR